MAAQAAEPMMVRDINPGDGFSPGYLTVFNDKLYFQARDEASGYELWESDGTSAGTKLVKDINNGKNNSSLGHLTVFSGKLYFSASDGTSGSELWESDGTAEGTKLVKDINSGSDHSYPSYFTVFNGKLYFRASEGTHGYELWESDGTAAGTKLVKDINKNGNSDPMYLTVFNGKLYFQADDGMHGNELWESDGTEAGTKLVKDIQNGSTGSFIEYLTVFNGKLYFQAGESTHGNELWESDGTEAGTKLFKNINNGASFNSSPSYLIVFNEKLYFRADDDTHGTELWESDGTADGTKLVKDINSGGGGSSPIYPSDLMVFNGKLYFGANDGTHGDELWESDGTADGTKLVKDINPGSSRSSPEDLTVFNGKLYFGANDGTHGNDLWVFAPLMLESLSPADNATDVAADGKSLTLVFSETISIGTGNIALKKSDDTPVETIDVTSNLLTVNGKTVIITLSKALESGTAYYIHIDGTAFKDSAGNAFAGISDKTTWNFTTATGSKQTSSVGNSSLTIDKGSLVSLEAINDPSGYTTGETPVGMAFDLGIFRFTIDNLSASAPDTVRVSFTLPSDIPANATIYKINSQGYTPLTVADHGLSISGKTFSFNITDNSSLDTDPTLGKIIDPVAVGVPSSTATPASGGSGSFSLLGLILGSFVFGLAYRRRLIF